MAKLYFRYGAMNAGKSTALIQVAYNYQERGMQTVLLKPQSDTKAGKHISSRIGLQRAIDYRINPQDQLLKLLADYHAAAKKPACILVDEVQFLEPKQIDELFEIAALRDIPVICYGLRTDFQLQNFPASARLLALAHSIEELKTICRCGKKATCNLRLLNGQPIFEGEQVAIDWTGAINYESVCSHCYFKLKKGEKLTPSEKSN